MNRHVKSAVAIAALGSAVTLGYGQTQGPQTVASTSVAPSVTAPPTKPGAAFANDEDNSLDPASLLPDLPSLTNTKASLIGGTIQEIDRVRDEMTVRIFGAGSMKIFYDPRTHILQGSGQASPGDLQSGDRVYVDTVLDGSTIFARNIRLATSTALGKSQGAVISFNPGSGELLVRDQLSPTPVKLLLDFRTEIRHDGHTASAGELAPGTLVDVAFTTTKNGRDATRISILAVPGAKFTFSGQVTSLDLHIGSLVLTSESDHKTYEIYLDPSVIGVDGGLRPGATVTAVTNFDGKRYVAQSVLVNPR